MAAAAERVRPGVRSTLVAVALLKYALARVVVLLAVAGVLYLAGARSWLLWLGALVLAAMVSYLVLPGVRDDAARVIAHRERDRARVSEDDAEEDRLLDEQEADGEPAQDSPDDDASPSVDDLASDGVSAPDDDPRPGGLVESAGSDDSRSDDEPGDGEPEDEPRGASSLENVPEALADSPTYHRDDHEERDGTDP